MKERIPQAPEEMLLATMHDRAALIKMYRDKIHLYYSFITATMHDMSDSKWATYAA